MVLHLHGRGIDEYRDDAVRRWFYKWTFAGTWVILLSTRLYGEIAPYVKRERCWVVPNGVPPSDELDGESAPVSRTGIVRIVFLSNMIPEKGPLEVVGAVERLHREGIRVTASLVGEEQSTAFQRVLLSRISAAGLGDIVEYSGPMHGRAKWQCLLRSDIFVFPSSYKYEAFPLVILEAMAASLPVVATDIGAVGDMVVDGETGFLVPQGDSEALADKLRMLCNDSDLRHRMGAAGKERFQAKFSFERFETSMAKVLQAAMGTRGRVDA